MQPTCFHCISFALLRAPTICDAPAPARLCLAQALAERICNGTTEDASFLFSSQVLAGEPTAEAALAALLHAQTVLGCLEGSAILSIISPLAERAWCGVGVSRCGLALELVVLVCEGTLAYASGSDAAAVQPGGT